jgi:hypothetical protein
MIMLHSPEIISNGNRVAESHGRTRLLLAAVAMTAMALTGCSSSSGGLDEGTVFAVTSGQTLKLDSEQVSIKPEHVTCGVQNDLFDQPTQSGTRTVARLTEKGRALGFSDDVTTAESGYSMPYTQVRGTFPVEIRQVVSIKDATQGEKKVEAWAGIKIDHSCFPAPLAIMGIRRGTMDQSQPAAFAFVTTGSDWHLDHILHQ